MTAVAQAFDTSEREIVIERLEVFRTGFTKRRPWTLYTVHAKELDGAPITVTLRTFDSLMGVVRVTIEPFENEGGAVTHYTLKRAKDKAEQIRERRNEARAAITGQAPPTPDADEPSVKDRLAAAEVRIEALEGRLTLLASLLGQEDQ
jgi:hypothetical protein